MSKINTLYLPIYSMEQSKIYFKNGASILITKYINKLNLPCDLQDAILKQNFANVVKLIRKYKKELNNNKKLVTIKYTCDIFSKISNKMHHVENVLASGYYNNLKDITQIVNNHKNKNNNANTKNLKYSYNFIMR